MEIFRQVFNCDRCARKNAEAVDSAKRMKISEGEGERTHENDFFNVNARVGREFVDL